MIKHFSFVVILACFMTAATETLVSQKQQERAVGLNSAADGEEWYLRAEDNAAELYVYEVGKGEPVVVVHGGFGAEYSSLLDAVSGLENSFRFVFYDQRGSLRSPAKPEFISIENHVQDLETLRKELGLEKMTIFAHSNGTLLTMHYLQKYPENIKNIVFVGAVSPKKGGSLDASKKPL